MHVVKGRVGVGAHGAGGRGRGLLAHVALRRRLVLGLLDGVAHVLGEGGGVLRGAGAPDEQQAVAARRPGTGSGGPPGARILLRIPVHRAPTAHAPRAEGCDDAH